MLEEEKVKLQECVENLNHTLREVSSKVENLENHNANIHQEVEVVSAEWWVVAV